MWAVHDKANNPEAHWAPLLLLRFLLVLVPGWLQCFLEKNASLRFLSGLYSSVLVGSVWETGWFGRTFEYGDLNRSRAKACAVWRVLLGRGALD